MSSPSDNFGLNIRRIEGALPAAYDQTVMGVVVADPSNANKMAVNVQGNVIAALWVDPVVPAIGDSVLVQLCIGTTGQMQAVVKGKVTGSARPARATVTTVPPSSNTVTVTGTDGITYTATFIASYTPVVNDVVYLSWFGSNPNIMGKVAATAAPVGAPVAAPVSAPPPPPPTTGETPYPAADSATLYPPGGWDTWAGGRGRVYQGSYGGSGQIHGAWWYSGSPAQLSGRNINTLQIILGSRLNVGSYNSPVLVHLYAITDAYRPGRFTDVARVVGPFNVIANPGQGPTTYDITASGFAPTLLAGGSIAIDGDVYCGFKGTFEEPDSGKLIFDWSM